jgi:murein DD-endopeptidase MepM/ murein hydrolase activator NlpD/SH3-like domain-containing protein
MKAILPGFIGIVLLLSACTSTDLFGPRSPHSQYADGLKKAGLDHSSLGQKWLTAAEKCFTDSTFVPIPYRESGFFAAEIPQAVCVRFKPKRGQKVTIHINIRSAQTLFFAELWRVPEEGKEPKLLAVADSTLTIIYEQERDRELMLHLQSELLVSVSFTLTIVADPSLAFPVPGNDGTKVGSFWGDARDAGKRSHEGIDIFDTFRTPVIAASDGIVTRVNENRLGGKTVWLNPAGKSYMLYYAHLDSQIAKPLQQVNKGDTLGLMGNTGNAKHTPTHLHFGIYANGAVDPLPFVQQVSKIPDPVKGDTALFNKTARVSVKTGLLQSPGKKTIISGMLQPQTLLMINGASGSYYRVRLPDGTSGFVPIRAVAEAREPVKTIELEQETELLADADINAALIDILAPQTAVETYATFNNYRYVKYRNRYGWIYDKTFEPLK